MDVEPPKRNNLEKEVVMIDSDSDDNMTLRERMFKWGITMSANKRKRDRNTMIASRNVKPKTCEKSRGRKKTTGSADVRVRKLWFKSSLGKAIEGFSEIKKSPKKIRAVSDDVNLVMGGPLDDLAMPESDDSRVRRAFEADWSMCQSNPNNEPAMIVVERSLKEDPEAGDRFKRNFMVFIMSWLLAPTNHANYATWRFLNRTSSHSVVNRIN